MAVWNIVNMSYIIDKGRIDAEFYKPSDIKNEKVLLSACGANILKEYVFEIPEKFKKSKCKDVFQYNDISNVDLTFGIINKNIIKCNLAPGRATYINKENDILISTVRPNRNANAIINRLDVLQVGSNGFCNLRSKKIDPNYIFIYSKTNFFRKVLIRATTATMYPAVSNRDILNVPFYIPSSEDLNEISLKVKQARQNMVSSQKLYQEAEELLEKELGLDQITFDEPLSYTANFSEVINNNRADAEYYQPKYNQIKKLLSKLKWTYLKSIIEINKGIEVGSKKYVEDGVNFIRVSNITKFGFNFGNSDKYISKNTYYALKNVQLQIGDILLTKDGTVGISYVVDKFVQGIVSGGVLILKNKNEEIPKEYLSLVINSKICQMQIEQDCSGALISHWKISDVYRLKIPLLETEIMQTIDELILKSKKLKRQSQQLLEEAKQRVEQLIEEEAAKKGININEEVK